MSKAGTPGFVRVSGSNSMQAGQESRQMHSCPDLVAIPKTCRATLHLNCAGENSTRRIEGKVSQEHCVP